MLDPQVAIKVENLSKCFHIYNKPIDRLKQYLTFNRKKYYQEFWALKNLSFEVKKGDSLGIIGRNGSGKSTLLQLLCKTLTPTTGSIRTNGQIAALLELGAGFNPEFTGRENIYLNGALHGLKRGQVDAQIDNILAFADIGQFIDQPVKTYSSGMFVKLAFSVQIHSHPTILIVDEALSVGDVFFQQKCARYMQTLRDRGTTLLFVSHDMSIVRDLCDKAVYLNLGELQFYGSSHDAIRSYLTEQNQLKSGLPAPQISYESNPHIDSFIHEFKKTACWQTSEISQKKEAHIIAVRLLNHENNPTLTTRMTNNLKFQILYQNFTDQPVNVGLTLRNRYDHIIHSCSADTHRIPLPSLKLGAYSLFEIELEGLIEAGIYTFSAILGHVFESANLGVAHDETPWLGPLTITWDYNNEKSPWFGMFGIPGKARFIPLNSMEKSYG